MTSSKNKFSYSPPVQENIIADNNKKVTPEWGHFFTILVGLISDLRKRVKALENP